MPQDYYPSGPFLGQLPDAGEFDLRREDFLLGYAERTARAYKADLEDFREWCAVVQTDPINVSAEHLEQYVASLVARRFAPGTIKRHVAALRGFFRHLVDKGVRRASPANELRATPP